MIPLATSGTAVVAVTVTGAILLLAVLLSAESRNEARERRERNARDDSDKGA
ncbi:MAG TPA: hypothetical protein VK252_08545 [Solirubrobacteraceae bacterium]|nr:hypothetical protein [Solirubrobacteraceae bacterium]